jgi:DNA-binding winged helix-turn-helix (wHTH) protein
MTIRDADSPAQMRANGLRFDRYVLDLDRGCLLLDGNEIALRPKTFAVLHYLVYNSGRLVSKDELFAEVWPNLSVTDDALVQSIGELRRALGNDGARLIKTIPRRGYRFEADVSVVAPVGAAATAGTPVPATFQDAAQSSEPGIRARAARSLTTALTGRRGRLYAVLALGILLAAGALWAGLGPERTFPRSGDHLTKSAEMSATPAIAILPLANQSDDSARDYFADGLTQDIISALGRFSALTAPGVVPRRREFRRKRRNINMFRNLGV